MSQKDEILQYLQSGQGLTPRMALDRWGCFRLGARIYQLRRAGYNIVDERAEHGTPYSVYRLVKP